MGHVAFPRIRGDHQQRYSKAKSVVSLRKRLHGSYHPPQSSHITKIAVESQNCSRRPRRRHSQPMPDLALMTEQTGMIGGRERRRYPRDVRQFAVRDIGEDLRRRINDVGAPIGTAEDRAIGLVGRPKETTGFDIAGIISPGQPGVVGRTSKGRNIETDANARTDLTEFCKRRDRICCAALAPQSVSASSTVRSA